MWFFNGSSPLRAVRLILMEKITMTYNFEDDYNSNMHELNYQIQYFLLVSEGFRDIKEGFKEEENDIYHFINGSKIMRISINNVNIRLSPNTVCEINIKEQIEIKEENKIIASFLPIDIKHFTMDFLW